MNERALERLFEDLGRSLDRLAKALRVPAKEPLVIDGTLQRFEFTFELFWKVVRRLLARQGVEANRPKAVLQQAYRLSWLDDERRWLQLLEDRSLTSHTYREALAREIYGRIPAHHAAMLEAARKLRATS
jgi:nucleotidyltransferase substrate binding protein (TIGR01987 family)